MHTVKGFPNMPQEDPVATRTQRKGDIGSVMVGCIKAARNMVTIHPIHYWMYCADFLKSWVSRMEEMGWKVACTKI